MSESKLFPGDKEVPQKPLDGDALNQLIGNAMMGKEKPSIEGEEAKAFFEKVKQDVERLMQEGKIIDLPNH
jgi:hypothetical protein